MQYFDLGILTRRINYFCWKVSIILYYSLYKQQDKPWDWFCEGGLTLNRQYKKVEHSDREVSRYRRCRILHKLSIFIILSSANFFSFFIIGITFLALSAVLLLSFVYFLNINRSTCLFYNYKYIYSSPLRQIVNMSFLSVIFTRTSLMTHIHQRGFGYR